MPVSFHPGVRRPRSGNGARKRGLLGCLGVAARHRVDHAEVVGQVLGLAAVGGLQRAQGVAQPDRVPLDLVAVEQLVAGPAARHPAELPAEVVCVGDAGVHAGRPARGRPVGRVADEEDPPGPHPLRDGGGEGPAEDADHLGLEIGHAGGHPDRGPMVLDGGNTLRVALRRPLAVVDPPARCARRHEHARLGRGDDVQGIAVTPDPLLDLTVEQDGEVLALGAELALRDAGRAAHGAAGTVGAHDVANPEALLVAAASDRPEAGATPRRSRWSSPTSAGAEPDDTAERPQVLQQQRLEVVLRAHRREARAERGQRLGLRQAERELLLLPVRERRGHRRGQPEVGAAGAHQLLETPRAQDLHRAWPDAGRLRDGGRALVPLDDQHARAGAGGGDGGGEADGPAPTTSTSKGGDGV